MDEGEINQVMELRAAKKRKAAAAKSEDAEEDRTVKMMKCVHASDEAAPKPAEVIELPKPSEPWFNILTKARTDKDSQAKILAANLKAGTQVFDQIVTDARKSNPKLDKYDCFALVSNQIAAVELAAAKHSNDPKAAAAALTKAEASKAKAAIDETKPSAGSEFGKFAHKPVTKMSKRSPEVSKKE